MASLNELADAIDDMSRADSQPSDDSPAVETLRSAATALRRAARVEAAAVEACGNAHPVERRVTYAEKCDAIPGAFVLSGYTIDDLRAALEADR